MNNQTVIKLHQDNPLVTNPLNQKKAEIDKWSLASLILSKELPSPSNELINNSNLFISEKEYSDKFSEFIDHWAKRNWLHSFHYYMWSRINHLKDEGENYEQKQEEVLTKYLKKEGMPQPIKNAANPLAILGEGTKVPWKSTAEILKKRKSVRSGPTRRLSLNEVSAVLYHGSKSLRDNRVGNLSENILNAVDSFGTAYDILFCVYNLEGIESGIYFYDPSSTAIELTKKADEKHLRDSMYKIQTEQIVAKYAAYSIILVANFERYQWRYRHEAALQHIFINAGQILHPFILFATAFGHFTHISPAINDNVINYMMGFEDSEKQAIYIMSAG